MFRKKDADPIRPAGAGDKPADGTLRSPMELRSPGPTESAPPRPTLAPPLRDVEARAPSPTSPASG